MPRAPTYAQAQDHLLNVLQLQNWDVARTDARGKKLKVPHATKGRARIYFKSQSLHFDCGPPFSLNSALSTHDDPRELAELVGDDSVLANKMSWTLEGRCLRDNPRSPTIKVPPSAYSVFETDVLELAADPVGHGLDAEETRAYQLVAANLTGDRLAIPGDKGEREAMASLFTELSNTFDDYAEYGGPGEKKFNRAAAKGLASISYKLGVGRARNNPITDMPGGSVTECIKQHRDKDDPGAYCAAIADRIEPGWRGKSHKGKRKNNPNTASDLVRKLKF